ncbi:nuclear transport factor 2 family protein [Actinomadura sp. ATCC 31491]|uniref:Nuclear transport factor 2 family protein n=1 Tax=Actinomadura luzonensis TaxID=2805427 RepID=A0ABT0G918_9ACTN|nr:nuclear transport factor 2 family protein [Actinomadura luzonensis]MCK2221092.1 nuclear transport factor 2 family protein [Actinomadura luzonensis]
MTTTGIITPAELRAEVEQFYAAHFHLLDEGRAEEWALTFTDDGVFHPPGGREPVRGRAALAGGVGAGYRRLLEADEVHRHWHGMIEITPRAADGAVLVRCYALILATPSGGPTRTHLSCVCEDVLVRVEGRLLVRERRVHRDDQRGT